MWDIYYLKKITRFQIKQGTWTRAKSWLRDKSSCSRPENVLPGPSSCTQKKQLHEASPLLSQIKKFPEDQSSCSSPLLLTSKVPTPGGALTFISLPTLPIITFTLKIGHYFFFWTCATWSCISITVFKTWFTNKKPDLSLVCYETLMPLWFTSSLLMLYSL